MGGVSEAALGGAGSHSVPKQLILLLVASIAAIFFKSELVRVMNLLVHGHNEIFNYMALVFSGDVVGRIIQGVIALLLIPVALGVLCSIAYYIVKKTAFPYALTVIWGTWLILLTTLLAHAG